MILLLQAGLFENTIERANWHIQVHISWNNYRSRFVRMMELAVAAFGSHDEPTVVFDQFDNRFDFHILILPIS